MGQPKPRSRRLNRRALIISVIVVVVLAPGLVAVKMLSDQMGAAAFLKEAKSQVKKGNPGLAIGYLNRYLDLAPGDLDALELKSRVMFDAIHEPVRDPAPVMEALKVHAQLIAGSPGDARWEQARRRMVKLNMMV